MKFKIGLLVLVLVLENIVADQRLSKDPTDSFVSALQHGPHSRQTMPGADQSPVRGLLSSGFHHSFNFTGATCLWDDHTKKCALSISGMKRLLEESDTEFAKMLVERLVSSPSSVVDMIPGADVSGKDKQSRLRQGEGMSLVRVRFASIWTCVRVTKTLLAPKPLPFILTTEKLGPNVPEAIPMKVVRARENVGGMSTLRIRVVPPKALLSRYSYWFWICFVDEKLIYYGIKHFEYKCHKVKGMVFATLKSEYSSLQSAENFTWQSILDYKPESIECPSGIEQLVCDYVVAYWSGLQSREFYCSGRYESDKSGCRSDALCEWNTDSAECRNDRGYPTFADQRLAWKVLTDSMPEGTDKSLREAYYRCRLRSERECFTEQHCIWNPPGGYCTRNKHYIATLLTKPGKDSADGLCTFLAVDGFSDCYDTFTEADCNQTKVCHWDKHQRCRPKEELYIAKAVELDPELRNKYLQVKGRCSRHTSLIECIEDDHFSSKVKLST